MDQIDLEKSLQKHFGNIHIRLPKKLNFFKSNEAIEIQLPVEYINGPDGNMQKDNGAFEPWSLALRMCHPDRNSILKWKCIDDVSPQYRQFLYRVYKFSEVFSWFCLEPEQMSEVREIIANLKGCKVNQEGSRSSDRSPQHKEAVIASEFASSWGRVGNLVFEKGLNYELPLGLFKDNICEISRQFPTARVDLWGVEKECLHIYELKRPDKKMAGIISQALFYGNFLNDIVIQHKFLYEGVHSSLFRNVKAIKVNLLVNQLHPLVTQEMCTMLNLAYTNAQIPVEFAIQRYEENPLRLL